MLNRNRGTTTSEKHTEWSTEGNRTGEEEQRKTKGRGDLTGGQLRRDEQLRRRNVAGVCGESGLGGSYELRGTGHAWLNRSSQGVMSYT
jgi:hypothetical protein